MFMLITFIIAQMKNRCLALKRKTFNKAYRVALLFADKRYIAFSFWCGIDHVPKPVQIPDFGVAFDFRGAVKMLSAIKKGGKSYEATIKKEKRPYIFVGMLVVRKQYQGQGYMRKALEIAFGEGIRRDCPVLLETDAVLKRDKYVHLGMKNIRTRKLDDSACLYDLVKES